MSTRIAPRRSRKIPSSAIILSIVTFSLVAAIMLWGDALPFLRWIVYDRPQPPASGALPTERISRIKGVVASGQTFATIMSGFQVPPEEADNLVRAATPHVDLARLQPGTGYWVTRGDKGNLLAFELDVDAEHILKLTRKDGGFSAEMATVECQVKVATFHATISGTLREAFSTAGKPGDLAREFSGIFAGTIDFAAEARAGDQVRVLYEEKMRDGRVQAIGRILAAEYAGGAKTLAAVYYEDASGKGDYYTPEGASLRKIFLKSPLGGRYSKVAPVRRTRQPVAGKPPLPVEGVSFTAPVGAPVVAVADGKVVFAGKRRGAGNLLVIHHTNGYAGYYNRLSGFGSGIRRGRKVSRGDLVGYVGTVGRGTGSYLDFRVQMGKRAADPVKLFNAPAAQVAAADSTLFAALVKERLDLMRRPASSPPSPRTF